MTPFDAPAGFEFQFFIHLQILASSFYFHLQNQNWTGIFFWSSACLSIVKNEWPEQTVQFCSIT